jgi:hypothetical protein
MSLWVPLIVLPIRGFLNTLLGDFDTNISKNRKN